MDMYIYIYIIYIYIYVCDLGLSDGIYLKFAILRGIDIYIYIYI